MPALQLTNPTSVVITTSADSSGNLEFTCQSNSLSQHENSLHIQHESLPITIEFTDFSDSCGQWTVNAAHEDENDDTQTWSRTPGAARCAFSWSETNQVHEVEVTASNSSASEKKKSVLIKVRPYPDQPDPV